MTDFLHLSADGFLLDTFRLGRKVYESGFRPKHVLSIWRGGTPVGLGVDGYFRTRGIFLNHTTIATESYTGVREQGEVTVKGLEHVIDVVCREDGLLIVDDVLESGNTIRRIVEVLRERARANMPRDIRVATVHRKPERVQFDDVPAICLEDLPGDVWIDYPHELADLVDPADPDDGRIREKSEAVWRILREAGEPNPAPVADGTPILPGADELLLDSFRLGMDVVRDPDFHPDFLVALWPGGINTGLPVHEVFKYAHAKGLAPPAPDHISLTTMRTRSSYRSDIVGINYLVDHVDDTHRVLIVDTTFRSGQVVNDVLMKLKEAMRRNLSLERVRVASVYYNPGANVTWTVPPVVAEPHYWVRRVDAEVVYPQSVHKLQDPERRLATSNPALARVIYGVQ